VDVDEGWRWSVERDVRRAERGGVSTASRRAVRRAERRAARQVAGAGPGQQRMDSAPGTAVFSVLTCTASGHWGTSAKIIAASSSSQCSMPTWARVRVSHDARRRTTTYHESNSVSALALLEHMHAARVGAAEGACLDREELREQLHHLGEGRGASN
jgi:hypothetical protein